MEEETYCLQPMDHFQCVDVYVCQMQVLRQLKEQISKKQVMEGNIVNEKKYDNRNQAAVLLALLTRSSTSFVLDVSCTDSEQLSMARALLLLRILERISSTDSFKIGPSSSAFGCTK